MKGSAVLTLIMLIATGIIKLIIRSVHSDNNTRYTCCSRHYRHQFYSSSHCNYNHPSLGVKSVSPWHQFTKRDSGTRVLTVGYGTFTILLGFFIQLLITFFYGRSSRYPEYYAVMHLYLDSSSSLRSSYQQFWLSSLYLPRRRQRGNYSQNRLSRQIHGSYFRSLIWIGIGLGLHFDHHLPNDHIHWVVHTLDYFLSWYQSDKNIIPIGNGEG